MVNAARTIIGQSKQQYTKDNPSYGIPAGELKRAIKTALCRLRVRRPNGRECSVCALYVCALARAWSRVTVRDCACLLDTGDTIDDVPGTSVECGTTYGRMVYDGKGGLPKGDCLTQLPFYGISFGIVWSFRALGAVYTEMGGEFAIEGCAPLCYKRTNAQRTLESLLGY